MTSVFISYSRRDKAFAEYIAAELRNREADVFIDYQRLTGGENFIGRLGREIEQRDCVVLLISSRSVASKWVQAEVAWAFTKGKAIIPVVIETAPLVDFFFLINVEQIDLATALETRELDAAIRKLAIALNLSTDPVKNDPVPRLTINMVLPELPDQEVDSSGAFEVEDLRELFLTAVEVADDDPEQANFLYRRVLQTDPDFMQGKIKVYVEREEERLKPTRVKKLVERANAFLAANQLDNARQVANDLLEIDPTNADARSIIHLLDRKPECDPFYEQAILAAERGRWKAVRNLLRMVYETCPHYGDPEGLTKISPLTASGVREVATLKGHQGWIRSISISSDGKLLASCSSDGLVRLWDIERRSEISVIGKSNNPTSILFIDDAVLCISFDAGLTLWNILTNKAIATLNKSDHQQIISVYYTGELVTYGNSSYTTWDISTGRILKRYDRNFRIYSSDNRWYFGNGDELGLFRANDNTGSEQIRYINYQYVNGNNDLPKCVAFSSNANYFAYPTEKSIEIVNLINLEKSIKVSIDQRVASLAFSYDDKLLAVGVSDNSCRLISVERGVEVFKQYGHKETISQILFTPTCHQFISASHDGTIGIWGLD